MTQSKKQSYIESLGGPTFGSDVFTEDQWLKLLSEHVDGETLRAGSYTYRESLTNIIAIAFAAAEAHDRQIT